MKQRHTAARTGAQQQSVEGRLRVERKPHKRSTEDARE